MFIKLASTVLFTIKLELYVFSTENESKRTVTFGIKLVHCIQCDI